MSESGLTPEIFTAEAVGEPGARTFYVQVRGEFGTQTFLIEKAQMAALADKLREVLVMVDRSDTIAGTTPGRDPALDFAEPADPEWRVGTIGLAYDETQDRVVVFLQPVGDEEFRPEDTDPAPEAGDGVRFFLRRDQVRSFVLHALAVVGEGRPTCQLCGLPMDPDGHKCPASNGHNLGG